MENRSKEIVKRFQQSWDEVEKHYETLLKEYGWEYLTDLTKAIKYWREKNFDNYFRAGNAIYYLILSRSVDHGLRPDQKRILIIPNSDGIYEIKLFDGQIKYKEFKTKSLIGNQDFERLLKVLKSVLVD